MIDITRAQANQSTINGVDEDWIVTLEDEEIYKLPAKLTPQETFDIRDIIEKMMNIARQEEQKKGDEKIAEVIKNGDAVLDSLKDENIRLSTVLEEHILREVA